MTGCAPPSTRRAVRVVSSSVSLRPHGDRQAWPRRRCRVVTGGASSISRLSSALRDDTTVVATAARAPTASATRSSSSRGPRARLSTATAQWLRGLACVARSFRSSRAPGSRPSEPTAGAALFLGNETALCPRARQRFVADGCCARVLVVSDLSSTSKLVELAFCYDRVMCLSNEPI